MQLHATDPLFAWLRLEDHPALATLRDLLACLPDQALLAGLRAARAKGRDDYPVPVLWGVVVLTVALRHRDFESCLAELADKGVLGSPEELEALEAQLARALREKPDRPSPDVRGVARRLLAALRERPEGTAAMAVTDGTAGA